MMYGTHLNQRNTNTFFHTFKRIFRYSYRCLDSFCFRKALLVFLLFLSPSLLSITSNQWIIQNIHVEDGLPDSTVFSIQQDQEGFLWFGTTNGVARFDGYAFKIFKHDDKDSQTISNNNAGNIFIDSKNNLWVGTFGGGANKLDLTTGKLTRLPYSSTKDESVVSANVQTFFEDKNSNIWIGTASGLYQLEQNNITHYGYEKGDNNGLINSRVWDILEDEQNNIWVSTSDGLSRLNPQTGDFNSYKLPTNMVTNISSNQFRKLYRTGSTLWLGSSTGFFSFDIESKQFKSYSTEIKINDIYLIDKSHFLIASMDGLYLFNLEKGKFSTDEKGEVWQLLKLTDVRNIFSDQSGMLWLATRNKGVIKIDRTGGLFQLHHDFIPKDKLSEASKQIWSLKFDSYENLYLATSEMLFKKNKDADTNKNISTSQQKIQTKFLVLLETLSLHKIKGCG